MATLAPGPTAPAPHSLGAVGPASWLGDALRELDGLGKEIKVDGRPPTAAARREARALLRRLAASVTAAPEVMDDPFEAVAVEFCGAGRNRVLFVLERDGSASTNQYIDGRSADGRFENWQEMMEAVGWQGLRRAGLALRP